MSDEEISISSDICNLVNCKWNRKLLASYLAIMSPYMITSMISTLLIRLWTERVVFSIIYGSFLVIFFIFIRTKILCSHCPYYKEKRFLDPLPKIWKYSPRPMNQTEKIITSIGMLFFLIFPVSSQAYGAWNIITNLERMMTWQISIYFTFMALTIFTAMFFVLNLTSNFCIRCINFACPLNRVTKEVVDKYLELNKELKTIYQESGFLSD